MIRVASRKGFRSACDRYHGQSAATAGLGSGRPPLVTRGERFAFLPFLYDDAAAKIREANNKYLDESLPVYTDGPAPPV